MNAFTDSPAEPVPVRTPRVLIAEDDGLVAALTRSRLEAVGYTVVGTAADGHQAVGMTADLRPDVVVMDIAMPEVDGIEAAAAIQLGVPTPVVILTAHDEPTLLDRASAAGVGAFLIKPAQPRDLERAITIAIARHADLLSLRASRAELESTLREKKLLHGILPICCCCKRIRDDHNAWLTVEHYVAQRTAAHFSHTYCPVCLQKNFPDSSLPDGT